MKYKISSIIRIIKLLIINSLLIHLNACNSREVIINNNTIPFYKFPKEDSLFFKNFAKYDKGFPAKMYIIENTMIIQNTAKGSTHFFSYFNLGESKIINNSLLKKGKGPDEALGIKNSGISNNLLWAFDITKNQLFLQDFNFFKSEIIGSIDTKHFDDFEFSNMVLDNDLNYLYINGKRRKKISKYDLMTDSIIADVGDYYLLPLSIPFVAMSDALSSYLLYNNNLKRIALAYRYTDVLQIFYLNGDSVSSFIGPENINLEFEIGRNKYDPFMVKNSETRKAFVNSYSTDKYIYLLYSGHFYEDDNWSYGNRIYIYNWDGKPYRAINLDRYIYTFCVDKHDKLIYSYDLSSGNLIKANI